MESHGETKQLTPYEWSKELCDLLRISAFSYSPLRTIGRGKSGVILQANRGFNSCNHKIYSKVYILEFPPQECSSAASYPTVFLFKEGPYVNTRVYNFLCHLFGSIGVKTEYAKWLQAQTVFDRNASLYTPPEPILRRSICNCMRELVRRTSSAAMLRKTSSSSSSDLSWSRKKSNASTTEKE